MDEQRPKPARRQARGERPASRATERAIVLAWRRLTSAGPSRRAGVGAPTLVACSGGADSTALAIALADAGAPITLGHVLHDLRPRTEAEGDREGVRALARRLGVPALEAEVRVPAAGNREAEARRLRYAALVNLSERAGIAFVATAHHADDQFESLVMALLRGAGAVGLRGIAPRRSLGPGVWVVRPMLEAATRAECRAICEAHGVSWREDRTNQDRGRLRAALRHGALRELELLRPGSAARAARTARLVRGAAGVVRDRAAEVFGEASHWPREALRAERAVVVGEGLRAAFARLSGGVGLDELTARRLDPVVRAIQDDSTDPRRFGWPRCVAVRVEAARVTMDGGAGA